ncbi:L-threonine 3-O-phosphate decarboxylase [Nitrospina watsonii]|uniref:threonine-phosphate decarboxylase n=2 Tax=Nitrospina watsonii TaxID=1323948 RepID=A0ABN8W5H7_9BACT|nr:L-threonine 3-O-phosphate decarboxylase [Nitrospina watsonii]
MSFISRKRMLADSMAPHTMERHASVGAMTGSIPEHGGQAPSLVNGFDTNAPWVDFSTSINPCAPSEYVSAAIGNACANINRYPDPDASPLKRALSESLQISSARLIVGNGATELIYLLPHLLPEGREALILTPFFSEFEKAFRAFGIPVHNLRCDADDDFAPPVDTLLLNLKTNPRIGAVVLGHPNSPTGRLGSHSQFDALAETCESRGILLVVDESFIDFCEPGSSLMESYPHHAHLIFIRSMTKFYGLPGLRLGFGVMDPQWVHILGTYQPPWSVNSLAQAAGIAALEDTGFANTSRTYVHQQTADLIQGLNAIPEIKVYPSDANFVLFRLKDATDVSAMQLYTRLLQQGILLRNCANFDGLDTGYFRVSVRQQEDNQFLLAKLQECLRSGG